MEITIRGFENISGKIADIALAIVVTAKPAYNKINGEYVEEKGSMKVSVLCPCNAFSQLDVKIPYGGDIKQLNEELERKNAELDYVYCTFIDFEAKPRVWGNSREITYTCTAKDIKFLSNEDVMALCKG